MTACQINKQWSFPGNLSFSQIINILSQTNTMELVILVYVCINFLAFFSFFFNLAVNKLIGDNMQNTLSKSLIFRLHKVIIEQTTSNDLN